MVNFQGNYLLRKLWDWKLVQAAGKMSRKALMVVVESHRYKIISDSSYDRNDKRYYQSDYLL